MITIYQIPVSEWYGVGEPKDSSLWNSRIVVQGYTDKEILKELVAEINAEHIDDVNCYLYIHEK